MEYIATQVKLNLDNFVIDNSVNSTTFMDN